MLQPLKSGRALLEEIDRTITPTPTLWWLGQSGFIIRFATITFYIDTCLPPNAPLDPSEIHHADMLLCTQAGHLDAPTTVAMLKRSANAKLILPKSASEQAREAGIPFDRTTTTDADLRVEYFKDNLYARIYAIPSANPQLDWTAAAGYPYLGYLIRFGRWTIYHPGDCAMYDGLIQRLRPFNVSVALLPVGGKSFSPTGAAQLAVDIGAKWLVPITGEPAEENQFITHMLGQRPEQAFKVFRCAEKWTVPED